MHVVLQLALGLLLGFGLGMVLSYPMTLRREPPAREASDHARPLNANRGPTTFTREPLTEAEAKVMARAIADIASGEIGGRIGLTMQRKPPDSGPRY